MDFLLVLVAACLFVGPVFSGPPDRLGSQGYENPYVNLGDDVAAIELLDIKASLAYSYHLMSYFHLFEMISNDGALQYSWFGNDFVFLYNVRYAELLDLRNRLFNYHSHTLLDTVQSKFVRDQMKMLHIQVKNVVLSLFYLWKIAECHVSLGAHDLVVIIEEFGFDRLKPYFARLWDVESPASYTFYGFTVPGKFVFLDVEEKPDQEFLVAHLVETYEAITELVNPEMEQIVSPRVGDRVIG